MSGKDVLRLLLISYGFCRNIEISTYIGDGGWIGYEVSASNDDGIEYYAVDCEGLLFHIYEIQKFMRDGNIEPRLMLGNSSNKHLLSDESLNKLLILQDIRLLLMKALCRNSQLYDQSCVVFHAPVYS